MSDFDQMMTGMAGVAGGIQKHQSRMALAAQISASVLTGSKRVTKGHVDMICRAVLEIEKGLAIGPTVPVELHKPVEIPTWQEEQRKKMIGKLYDMLALNVENEIKVEHGLFMDILQVMVNGGPSLARGENDG